MPQLLAEEYVIVPIGEYPVKIGPRIEEEEGKFGKQLRFSLIIAGGEFKDASFAYWTPCKLTTENKLGKLLQAAGFVWESGDMVDIDDLKGKIVNATIIIGTNGAGEERNKIEGIRPYKKAAKPAAKPAPAPAPVANDDDDTEDVFADE
jgi:hypothetical protein